MTRESLLRTEKRNIFQNIYFFDRKKVSQFKHTKNTSSVYLIYQVVIFTISPS